MPRIPEEIRELWKVSFETRINAGRSRGEISLQESAAFVLVWGRNAQWADQREIIELALQHPPKSGPMLRILNCEPTGILESHIRNQPQTNTTLAELMVRLESGQEQQTPDVPTDGGPLIKLV